MAAVADATTDRHGRVHVRHFVDFLRGQSVEELRALRQALERAKSSDDSVEQTLETLASYPPLTGLLHALAQVDFARAIELLISILVLVLTLKTFQETQRFNASTLAIQERQAVVAEEQLKEQRRAAETSAELERRIRELEAAIGNARAEAARPVPSPFAQARRIKGRDRNLPCRCGSGQKAKRCRAC